MSPVGKHNSNCSDDDRVVVMIDDDDQNCYNRCFRQNHQDYRLITNLLNNHKHL